MVTGVNRQPLDESAIWREMEKITDPEIPVLSLVDMKIIRSVTLQEGKVTVVFSPTFVGCPALEHIKNEIREHLGAMGCTDVDIETTYSPPWSTEMLDENVREKLRAFGIAPPAISPDCCNSHDSRHLSLLWLHPHSYGKRVWSYPLQAALLL